MLARFMTRHDVKRSLALPQFIDWALVTVAKQNCKYSDSLDNSCCMFFFRSGFPGGHFTYCQATWLCVLGIMFSAIFSFHPCYVSIFWISKSVKFIISSIFTLS